VVGLDGRGVLDLLVVVGHPDAAAGLGGLGDRDKAQLHAEQAGLDRKPLGLAGVGVRVDLVDRADLLAVLVNSAGGTTAGGEALFEAIRELAKTKPVVAQFGTLATSAAYIAGLATDQIVARGNTITGSVGVIFQWAEFSGLLDKIGVRMNEIKSGPLKANPSPFLPLDEAGRAAAEEMVAESFRWFLAIVRERRGVDTKSIPGLEQGRIFSGRDALAHKLVDRIGGEPEAVRYLEEQRSVPKDLKIVDIKPSRDSDWSFARLATGAVARLAGIPGLSEASHVITDQRLARLRLGGLLSIWHGTER